PAWRHASPKKTYDAVIIGGGGHGLGAAFHLARDHGISNVAVLEKGWLGGGNTGRNTMTIRDNFIYPDNARFHHAAVRAWHSLSDELNFNIMLSRRGMITILMSDRDLSDAKRMVNTSALFGAEHRIIGLDEVRERLPLAASPDRLPIVGGIYHPDVVLARHDAVAWGYARAASKLGVDIIENCEVTGILRDAQGVTGVDTSLGRIATRKLGMAVAGHGKHVAAMAGVTLPIETVPLQALVSTPVKPVLDNVVVLRGFNTYFMQSDKGELVMGAGTDPYPSYSQRGTPQIPESIIAAILQVFPMFERMQFMRQWAGILDITYDNTPILSKTPVDGFYVDVAGSGGFKTTPLAAKLHADLIANDRPDALIEAYSLERFATGRLILERASYGNR
ncbi:MAG: FAD-dependent oxidoreductase, partial [Gammaproteobacteria bacterium]|nr:FAD-dependent oxidoreductase [Gammaproteobacteria bacterium]